MNLVARHVRIDDPGARKCSTLGEADGFTLAEMLIAIFVMSFGLLAAGQMIFVAVSSASLARTKGNLSIVAQDKLEFLADLYARDPAAAELTNGDHGPVVAQVVNPGNNVALNRFHISWKVSDVIDPRPGKVLLAKQIEVTVVPINNSNAESYRPYSNKAAVVFGIVSPRT